MWNKAEGVSLRDHYVSHPKIKAARGGYINENLPSVLPHFSDPFSYVYKAAATTQVYSHTGKNHILLII